MVSTADPISSLHFSNLNVPDTSGVIHPCFREILVVAYHKEGGTVNLVDTREHPPRWDQFAVPWHHGPEQLCQCDPQNRRTVIPYSPNCSILHCLCK